MRFEWCHSSDQHKRTQACSARTQPPHGFDLFACRVIQRSNILINAAQIKWLWWNVEFIVIDLTDAILAKQQQKLSRKSKTNPFISNGLECICIRFGYCIWECSTGHGRLHYRAITTHAHIDIALFDSICLKHVVYLSAALLFHQDSLGHNSSIGNRKYYYWL